MARLLGRVPTTGPLYYIEIALNWEDAIWGDPTSGFCEMEGDRGSPPGCGIGFEREYVGLEPNLRLERVVWGAESVGAFVATRNKPDGPVCDGIRLGGARLTIEVEP